MAFAARMIRPRYLPDSIVAQKDWAAAFSHSLSQYRTVRPEGAEHQWRKMPPRELSVDLVADERGGRVTGRLEAS